MGYSTFYRPKIYLFIDHYKLKYELQVLERVFNHFISYEPAWQAPCLTTNYVKQKQCIDSIQSF